MALCWMMNLDEDRDAIHDLCIDFNELDGSSSTSQIYYRRVESPVVFETEPEVPDFLFFSDEPITDEVLDRFWKDFYGEEYHRKEN